MGCSHAAGCPLFPLLNASLQGWRDYYCDSRDQWRECARYKVALTGERVPISLLPNGHHAMHLRRAADADPDPAADRCGSGQAAPFTPFEPAPAPPPPVRLSGPVDRPSGRRARRASGTTRGLWARIIDWMSGPA